MNNIKDALSLVDPLPQRQSKRPIFLIVIHEFWMDSKGFKVFESNADNMAGAEEEAKVLCWNMQSMFNHCAYKVISPTIKYPRGMRNL